MLDRFKEFLSILKAADTTPPCPATEEHREEAGARKTFQVLLGIE